jgi:ribosomal protein S18 acetylase RimI-like enzyme
MQFQIKSAGPEDVPQIIALLREFAEFENLLDFFEVTEARLNEAFFGFDRIAQAILIMADEAPVGYAIFYPCFASFRGQRGIYLEDIYVRPKYRREGLGEMMLRHIAREAHSRGFERIDFQVLSWNTPAINFYEKLGARRDTDERHFKFTDAAFAGLAST